MAGFGSFGRARTRIYALLTALALLAPLLAAVDAAPAHAAEFPPRYERTIGGAGRPGVFSWGVQHNPVTDEILVSDYLNFKVRRYDKQGNHLGDFWRDNAAGQPYTIGVDHRDGSIYVAELKDNPLTVAIAKYDKHGTFLYAIPTRFTTRQPPPNGATYIAGFYTVWLTVEEDTGDVFLLDSHYNITDTYRPHVLQLRFNDATRTVDHINQFEINPPTLPNPCTNPGTCIPRAYGIDISDSDVIYMTDAQNQVAYRYSKQGEWLSTFGAGQLGGDNRGIVVNEALNRVYAVDAENSQVDMFTQAGAYVGSFGSQGEGPGQFSGGGRAIDIDDEGNVWVGDFGGFETEKFSATGTPLLRAPSPARKPPVGLLGQPRDVAVDPQTGEVWVADAWNQRFVRFSANGAHMGSFGQRGPGGPFQMNYPRSIGIDPATRRIWVANERGHHVQVYNYPTTAGGSPTYVRQVGFIGRDNTDPGNFRWPVDFEFYQRPGAERVVVIGDRMAASVKIFDADTYQELLMIPVANHGTAVDPATGNIYIINPTNDRIEVFDQQGQPVNVTTTSTGTPTNRFGTSGTGNGQLRDPVDGVIAGGVLYVTDEALSRVTAFSLDGQYLGRWGSSYSANIYDFKGAIGIAADPQGRLYVTDTYNDRIQVFNPSLGRQYEQVAPAAPTIATPAQTTSLPLAPVSFTGTATDNVAVGHVEIALQDHTTGLWWNASNQSWEDTKTWANAAWSGANRANVSWRWTFLGVTVGGRYVAEVRTRDHNATFSPSVMRTFAMPGQTAPPVPPPPAADNVRPTADQESPTQGEVILRAPITFSGTAGDNEGVQNVRIAIKNLANGRYLSNPASSATSSFVTNFVWHEATLNNPGQSQTDWSFQWSAPLTAGGSFETLVEVRDSSGNINGYKPQVQFRVVTSLPAPLAPIPAQVADLGGSLRAQLYPSGLEVAPDGTIVVADTGNNQVVKLAADGTELWRVGASGSHDGQFLRPRDVSVATDGTIFVVDTENERIIRLAEDGSWLGKVNTPARYFLGGSFKGDLYYLADIQRRVRVFNTAGEQVEVVEENGECGELFDIRDATADSNGRIFVANYRQNRVNVYSPGGTCLYSFGSTGTGDGQFRTPYGVATAFDPVLQRELVYVTDALNNRVQVFELDGTFVGKLGTAGTAAQPGTIFTLRRASVATDGSGDVWIADLWGSRIQRYARSQAGWAYAQTIGAPMGETTDDAVFHEPRGLAVDGDGVVHVMDSIHHQLVRMNQDGSIVNRCGVRGSGSGQFNWPRDLDIDQTTGDIWITDTKANRLQVLRPDCTFVAARGAAGSGDAQLNWPRAIAIRQSDRTAWVADTQNNRVVVWDIATRTFIGQYGTGNPGHLTGQLKRPMGIAVDQASGHVYVADTFNNRLVQLAAPAGATSISHVRDIAYGFDRPEALEIAPDGRIYVADTNDNEVVMLTNEGSWLASFGTGLDHPSGITVAANGDVLVSDSFGDRILIYSTTPGWQPPTPPPPPPVDTADPDATVTTPTNGQALTSSPITFAGNATDDVGVTAVRVAIRNTTTLQWWNGTGWQAGFVTQDAALASPGATSTAWSLQWAPPAEGAYAIQVIAADAAGKVDPTKPWVPFTYAAPGAPDGAEPDATVSSPRSNQVLTTSPITFTGNATDDVAVASVRIAIRNNATLQWWNGTGWQAAFTYQNAALASPGATATAWSFAWAPPAAGSYGLQVIAVDAAGKVDPTKPWVPFSFAP